MQRGCPHTFASTATSLLGVVSALVFVAGVGMASAAPIVGVSGPVATPCNGTDLCVTSGWSMSDDDAAAAGALVLELPWMDADATQWVATQIEVTLAWGAGIAGYLPTEYANQGLGTVDISVLAEDPFGAPITGSSQSFVLTCSPGTVGGRAFCAEGNGGPHPIRILPPEDIERLAAPGVFRWTWTGLDALAAPLEDRSLALEAALNVTVTYSPVPEPATGTLCGLGLALAGLVRRIGRG